MMRIKHLVVDGLSLAQYAYASKKRLASKKGERIGMIDGFIQMLLTKSRQLGVKRIHICWHGAEYEEAQLRKDPEFHEQLLRLIDVIHYTRWFQYSWNGVEAVHLMSCIARERAIHNRVYLLTNNTDMWQILSDTIHAVWVYEQEVMTNIRLKSDYGVCPRAYGLWKVVNGVSGLGQSAMDWSQAEACKKKINDVLTDYDGEEELDVDALEVLLREDPSCDPACLEMFCDRQLALDVLYDNIALSDLRVKAHGTLMVGKGTGREELRDVLIGRYGLFHFINHLDEMVV